MTDEEKKEYTECLNCDFWCDENECRSCNGYSKFKPNDEIKVVFLEKENLDLKKQVKELKLHCSAVDEVNEKMKCCGNCSHRHEHENVNLPCYDCTRDDFYVHSEKATDKWELME